MSRTAARQACTARIAPIALLLAVGGCASLTPERLAYEALQQRECAETTGVNCPAQAGTYDTYRAQRKDTLGAAAAGS